MFIVSNLQNRLNNEKYFFAHYGNLNGSIPFVGAKLSNKSFLTLNFYTK